jgi:hypothetical protein
VEPSHGDFYLQQGCCMSCGVPQAVAPALVGWVDDQNSTDWYWIRQLRNSDELRQAIRVIHEQDLDCHRYAGTDRKVIRGLPPAKCVFPSIGLFGSVWRRVFKLVSTFPIKSPLNRKVKGFDRLPC